MKLRLISMLVVLMLSASMAACSSGHKEISSISSPTNSPSSDEVINTQPPSFDSALDAYKAVLLDNAEFYSIDNQKKLTLNDFLTNKALYGVVFEATRFAVLDMDGDNVPEVVLELTVDQNPEFYEVLHVIDGAVYGYIIVYRGLEALKTDGTFLYSNGAADNGYGKLKFQKNAYEMEILGYTASSQTGGAITLSYFIDDQPVTEEAYRSFSKEQDEKDDVVWVEFSQAAIEAELQ